jgi:hypothetical protein
MKELLRVTIDQYPCTPALVFDFIKDALAWCEFEEAAVIPRSLPTPSWKWPLKRSLIGR